MTYSIQTILSIHLAFVLWIFRRVHISVDLYEYLRVVVGNYFLVPVTCKYIQDWSLEVAPMTRRKSSGRWWRGESSIHDLASVLHLRIPSRSIGRYPAFDQRHDAQKCGEQAESRRRECGERGAELHIPAGGLYVQPAEPVPSNQIRLQEGSAIAARLDSAPINHAPSRQGRRRTLPDSSL